MCVSVLNRPQRGCWNQNACLAGREKTVWFKRLIELESITIAVIVGAFVLKAACTLDLVGL